MPKKSNARRSDGRIAVQVYIGTFDGKRKYKTVYGKTQKEAKIKADEIKKYAPQKIPFVIEPFTLHCLRHTFCTMMYESGVDILVAQKQMGHSDVKTTLAIYSHLDETHQKSNISKLDEYISSF